MTSSYKSAITQMYALGHELAATPSHKFDLAHMRVLLRALGDPETKLQCVLIAGTNGKGSTAATLAAILQASGLKTGLYSSPHLIRINERIRLDGSSISDDDFALLHDVVGRSAERLVSEGELPWHPSFFEMLTAMAFEYFARTRPDIVVLEVGMGGRLDATNVVQPRLSVITDVALDHQQYLGNTVGEIAREKAGIIRAGVPVVTLPQMPEANDAIGNTILELGARAVSAVPYVPPVSPASNRYLIPGSGQGPTRQSYSLEVLGEKIQVQSPLAGRHQLRNVALAVASAEELHNQGFAGITARSIAQGIRETCWPGRFQYVPPSGGAPEMVLDVAHNPAGAWSLRSTLSSAYEDRPMTLVFAAMRDKAIAEMAEILFPIAEHVLLTSVNNPRSATPADIRKAAMRVAAEARDASDTASALAEARQIAGSNGLVVVSGSIYLVGEMMQLLGLRI